MRLVVFADDPDWHCRRLVDACRRHGAEVTVESLRRCRFRLGAGGSGIEIPGFNGGTPDVVFVRNIPSGSFEQVTFRLSLLHGLRELGVRVVNDARAIERCVDKSMTSFLLARAGIPTPATWATENPEQAADIVRREKGPLVLKPYRGSQGRGVHVIWDADELDDVSNDEGPVFAQRYHTPEGQDHKIYVIGEQMFGVKRIFPARTYEEKTGQPFTITHELREIALRCSRAFGVELFGFDVIISGGRPYVVDIQSFPGFKGVPDAELRLADYLYAAAQRAVNGEPFIGAGVNGRQNGALL